MSYLPTYPGETITPQWLYDQLQQIATQMALPDTLTFTAIHEAPPRPVEGLLAFADGVDWNPTGAGGGLHQYIGGVWDKL